MDEKQKHKKTGLNSQKNNLEENKNDRPKEIGGPKGLEPTRYGDWEKSGRCIDF